MNRTNKDELKTVDRWLLPITSLLANNFPQITPNYYSAARIILIPLILLAIKHDQWIIGFVLFLSAVTLDLIDGPLARLIKKCTAFGAFIDPLADKLLFISLLSYFIQQIPPVLAWGLIAIETLLLVEHVIKFFWFRQAESQKRTNKQSSGNWGKAKFVAEAVSIGLLFWQTYVPWFSEVAPITLAIALALSLKSLQEHVKTLTT